MSEHIHDCTGPDMRCPCGYVFRVPRFSVSFDVYDNDTKLMLVTDGFCTDSIGAAVEAFRNAAEKVEGLA